MNYVNKNLERLNELREQELERVKQMYETKLEEVRKSVSPQRKCKCEDDYEEKPASTKKQKLESKTHCTPPDEKEFWNFVRAKDAHLVKTDAISKPGKPYAGHYLICRHCKARWTLEYTTKKGYSLSSSKHKSTCHSLQK